MKQDKSQAFWGALAIKSVKTKIKYFYYLFPLAENILKPDLIQNGHEFLKLDQKQF